MPFIEDLHEFSARQGCEPIRVNNRYLFPNGAQSNGVRHSEPPRDPLHLLYVRREYVTARLDRLTKLYDSNRAALATQADYHARGVGPLPPDDWKDQLKKQSQEISRLQSESDEIEQQINNDPRSSEAAQKAHQALRRAEKQSAKDVLERLGQLPIF